VIIYKVGSAESTDKVDKMSCFGGKGLEEQHQPDGEGSSAKIITQVYLHTRAVMWKVGLQWHNQGDFFALPYITV
jgi:hypothetical protein